MARAETVPELEVQVGPEVSPLVVAAAEVHQEVMTQLLILVECLALVEQAVQDLFASIHGR